MAETADVVVVGGGVNGASIAYALAARGTRAVLCEKAALASGASGRSSALVDGRAKTVDIDAFGLRRFAEGRSPEGPYPYAPRKDHADP